MQNDSISSVIEAQPEGCTALITPEKQEEIFSRVCALFRESGMTVAQLSRVTYISERTLARYFQGKTKDPHFYTLITMIIAMGGDVNEILNVSTPTSPAPAENPYSELIAAYRDHTNTLTAAVDRMVARTRFFTVILIVLCLLVVSFTALEIVDLCTPNWGRYQWAVEIFNNFLHKV